MSGPIGWHSPYGFQYVSLCLTGQCDHDEPYDDEADDPDLDDDRENDPNPIYARERQVALYASGRPLRPQMRRKRAALDEAVAAGMAVLGSDRMIELAAVAELLTEHADHWHDARRDHRDLWPDRERFKLAGQLAESPVWNTP